MSKGLDFLHFQMYMLRLRPVTRLAPPCCSRRPLASGAETVRTRLLRLCDEHGAGNADLDDDLALKSRLLAACEQEFSLVVPSADLGRVRSVDEAISYFERRGAGPSETHWSRELPSNVTLDEEGISLIEGADETATRNRKPRRPNDLMGVGSG